MATPRIAAVKAIKGSQSVQVTWQDGTTDVVDLSEPIAQFPALAGLSDPKLFARVKVRKDGYDIYWSDELDYPAHRLWERARAAERGVA